MSYIDKLAAMQDKFAGMQEQELQRRTDVITEVFNATFQSNGIELLTSPNDNIVRRFVLSEVPSGYRGEIAHESIEEVFQIAERLIEGIFKEVNARLSLDVDFVLCSRPRFEDILPLRWRLASTMPLKDREFKRPLTVGNMCFALERVVAMHWPGCPPS